MEPVLQWLGVLFSAALGATVWLFRKGGVYNPTMPKDFTDISYLPETPPTSPEVPAPLLWGTPKHAYHSTRVICDEMGLTPKQKDIVCACVYQESQFSNSAVGRNKDPETGKVWSTDWGIFQVNDHKGWHIGKGLRFSSVEDVLANPERAARWMAGVMKETGKLQPWASWTTGAYKKWLAPISPMWLLG